MASDGIGIERLLSAASARVTLANAAVCAALCIALAFYNAQMVPALAAGFAIGALNMMMLFRTARRGVRLPAEKAGRFVTISYYLRFAAVAAVIAAVVAKGYLSPWPLVAGFAGSVIVTVCTMIYIAREEALHA